MSCSGTQKSIGVRQSDLVCPEFIEWVVLSFSKDAKCGTLPKIMHEFRRLEEFISKPGWIDAAKEQANSRDEIIS